MTQGAWSAALDTLVATDTVLGMTLARARVKVRYFDGGGVALLVKPQDVEDVAHLRTLREDVEPLVLAACAAVGLFFDAVGFCEEFPC